MTVELLPWEARQREEALLFNPAFLATLLVAAAGDHERVAGTGIPWALAFIVPPLVLFEDTRNELPANTNARLLNWISAHPNVRAQLPSRARSLAPLVRESARFGLRTGALLFAGDRLRSPLEAAALRAGASGEAEDCVTSAGFLGRWFASVVDVASVYALFGIAP
jgi:ABC-three component (ABC-3C) system Middle Component 3